jgi:formylglycine-generating enzyme required for sulfatase activity/uncharacterized caspase-like protein
MRRLTRLALAAVCVLGAAPLRSDAAPSGRRYAFLVGASEYLFGQQVGLANLKYADDDALAFGQALVDLGWPAEDVEVLTQAERGSGILARVVGPPTRRSVLERWKAFRERVRADAVSSGRAADGVVLLLSGHGVEFKGQPKGGLKVENTYFVPVDAEQMASDSLVDVQVMLEELQLLPVNRRWFVYDACRKTVEAASRDYAASSTMLQRLKVPQGTWLLLSCESGQASYEARQLGHGVFLHHLIEGMKGRAVNAEGSLTLTSLADYAASATQRWVSENLGGEEQLPVLKSEGTTWVLAQRARAPDTPQPAAPTPAGTEPAWARGLVSEAQRAEARRLGVPVAYEESAAQMRFVLIPGGTFMMGSAESDSSGYSDERPQHRVTVSPFYLSVYEVTSEQYRRSLRSHDSGNKFDGAAQPAVQVSHEDAEGYAGWLSGGVGGRPYRLPSEAEWEHACRAGTSTRWSFGDDESRLGEHGWFDGNGGGVTHDVGQKRPNGWGLFDMHGNVWEWCADDWHDTYAGAPTDGRAWIDSPRAAQRVDRGGSWFLTAQGLRSAVRLRDGPSGRNDFLGFRLARAVTPS